MNLMFFELSGVFLFDALLLYTGIFLLVGIINSIGDTSQNIEQRNDLSSEKFRLKVVMSSFGFGYILRATTSLLGGIYYSRYVGWMENNPGTFSFASLIGFVVQDVVPIGIMIFYHHKCFQTLTPVPTEQAVNTRPSE